MIATRTTKGITVPPEYPKNRNEARARIKYMLSQLPKGFKSKLSYRKGYLYPWNVEVQRQSKTGYRLNICEFIYNDPFTNKHVDYQYILTLYGTMNSYTSPDLKTLLKQARMQIDQELAAITTAKLHLTLD